MIPTTSTPTMTANPPVLGMGRSSRCAEGINRAGIHPASARAMSRRKITSADMQETAKLSAEYSARWCFSIAREGFLKIGARIAPNVDLEAQIQIEAHLIRAQGIGRPGGSPVLELVEQAR